MNSLCLDSTYKDLTVGLKVDDKVDYTSYECFQEQSELMIPEIKKLLDKHKVDPKSINEIIVTHGPGSYTGLRIALTIAKVYAYALNIPCYSLSSLNVLEKKDECSICLINARSKRSYIGVYKNDLCLLEDQIMTNEDVLKYISEHPLYKVCGDTSYLELAGYKANLVDNMLLLKGDKNKVKDIFTLKATYLKD